MEKFLNLYDRLEHGWHSLRGAKMISNVVLLFFSIGLFVSVLAHFGLYPGIKVSHFFAIELAFNILLICELLSLAFIFTRSVADSVGVQFEIVSLILLRNSFKELGYLPLNLAWNQTTMLSLLPLMTDAIGAAVVFLITGLFYKTQQHQNITSSVQEKDDFSRVKKIIALCLLVSFVVLVIHDFVRFTQTHVYVKSFNMYFTILVFTDIFVLIYSLRFSTRYNNLFRYSSFALATVIIRMSLSAPQYFNVILSVTAGLFVLIVTYIYNNLSEVVKK